MSRYDPQPGQRFRNRGYYLHPSRTVVRVITGFGVVYTYRGVEYPCDYFVWRLFAASATEVGDGRHADVRV